MMNFTSAKNDRKFLLRTSLRARFKNLYKYLNIENIDNIETLQILTNKIKD